MELESSPWLPCIGLLPVFCSGNETTCDCHKISGLDKPKLGTRGKTELCSAPEICDSLESWVRCQICQVCNPVLYGVVI